MSEWKNRSREYKKRHAARRLIENLTIEEKDAVRRKWRERKARQRKLRREEINENHLS